MTDLIPVVISGGSGTRLWPVSRQDQPKPFMRLPDGTTLLGKTLVRANAASPNAALLIVTRREHYFLSKDEAALALPPARQAALRYVLEPEGRNTAPAIGAAAHWIAQHVSPQALMLVLPADHQIEPLPEFVQAIQDAAVLARQGHCVLFGVVPQAPETAYGYIQCAPVLAGSKFRLVRRFVEKPDADLACALAASPDYLWNSGMLCVQAGALLQALAQCRPQLAQGLAQCWRHADQALPSVAELPAAYAGLESVSLDHAVLESSSNLQVLPVHFSWQDIGSWTAMAALQPPDANGNRVQGADALLPDSAGCYVHSQGRLVVGIGLRDLMVIDTPDALLLVPAARVHEVKQVVQQLRQSGNEACRLHRCVTRPWGTYTVLDSGPRYKIKRIEVKPGAALSLQLHHHRSEHWVVVSGSARVVTGEGEFWLHTDQSNYIPAGQRHRLENPGNQPLVMIEVQSGNYLSEDDIVRFDDLYGRTGPSVS